MSKREVTATFHDSLGRPLAGGKVYVQRGKTGLKGEVFFPADRHEITLTESGYFTIYLETTDDSELPIYYRWTIPSEDGPEIFDTILPYDPNADPISLAELRLLGVIPGEPYRTIADFIETNPALVGPTGPVGPVGPQGPQGIQDPTLEYDANGDLMPRAATP